MKEKIQAFKQHVREASANPDFIHHEWFVRYHLEVVEQIAFELCEHYPAADRELIELLVWLHDYGKIIDFDNQYTMTRQAGVPKLTELGFDPELVERVIGLVELGDKKLEVDLHEAPLEVQILATADACSHMVGPFHPIFWKEFNHLSIEELRESNRKKLRKDWDHKVILPEGRQAFQSRYDYLWEQAGDIPERLIP